MFAGVTFARVRTLKLVPTAFLILAVTLFQNVGIFDGKSAALSTSANVPVRGELGWIP